jgi:hypothetical protein
MLETMDISKKFGYIKDKYILTFSNERLFHKERFWIIMIY